MSFHSFSFRSSAKDLVQRALGDHEWIGTNVLSHAFHNFPVYNECGGLYGISYSLRTSLKEGLPADEAETNYERRIELYGTNSLPSPPVNPFWHHALEAVQDPMVVPLVIGGFISLAANTAKDPKEGWIEGCAILLAVVIVTIVTAYNNWNQELAFSNLAAELAAKANPVTVLRQGAQITIKQEGIVVGDVLFLSPGDMIPADGVLIDNKTIMVNESVLTGESDELEKNLLNPFLSAGTELTDGACSMVVTAVGMNSTKGQLLDQLVRAQEPTLLQERLEVAATTIGYIGLTVALLTFFALVIRWIFTVQADTIGADGFVMTYSNSWTVVIDYAIVAITILAVSIPEGLPIAVIVTLAFSLQRMLDDNNFVKVLSACETMGSATAVCSDKTGTLTQNRMTAVKFTFGGKVYDKRPSIDELDSKFHQLFIDGIICNSERRIDPELLKKTEDYESLPYEGGGGATDSALLSYLARYYTSSSPYAATVMHDLNISLPLDQIDIMALRDARRENILCFYPFSSVKKMSSVLIQTSDEPEIVARRYYKGAADRILQNCDTIVNAQGDVVPLNSGIPGYDANEILTQFTSVGLRCIALAYHEGVPIVIKDGQLLDPPETTSGWTLIGFIGIKDPLREETKDAVTTCQRAGIVVRMVTGDNLDTARFIAKDCGIITSERHIAMDGDTFRNHLEEQEMYKAKHGINNPDFISMVQHLRVLARCHPKDKLDLVNFLKSQGEIVGVTGDGSNDAPALRAADVGLVMNSGSEIAKNAGDIIILDDNFSSIVRAVMWGRSVYENIRKFLQFQLTVNYCAMVFAFIAAVGNGDTPLNAIELLWVNLQMDSFAALALSTESAKPTALVRKPFDPHGRLINTNMWKNIIVQGTLQLVILFSILYSTSSITASVWGVPGTATYDQKLHFTFIFNLFVWFQLFNEFNCRRINGEMNVFENVLENKYFVSIWIMTVVVQVFFVEGFGRFVGTVHQSLGLWLAALALAATQLLSGCIIRLFPSQANEGEIVQDEYHVFEGADWLDTPVDYEMLQQYTPKATLH